MVYATSTTYDPGAEAFCVTCPGPEELTSLLQGFGFHLTFQMEAIMYPAYTRLPPLPAQPSCLPAPSSTCGRALSRSRSGKRSRRGYASRLDARRRSNNMHLHKSVIGFATFFLVLALIVPPAERAHWGMQGIFLAMIAATTASFLAAFVFGTVRRKLRASSISGRDLARFMVGYTPETRVVESGSGVHLAQSGDLLSLLDLDDEQALALPDYDAESEEDKREEDEDLPDVIIEPHGLYLSKPYQPGVESILGQTVLFCGIRRSGKSNGMAVLAEEQARYGVPLVVGDTEDEYGPLADHRYMPRGVLVGSLDLLEAGSPRSNAIAIDVNGAYQFGQTILEDCLQVVLNLKSFASDEEAALVMCEIIAGMNEWESSRPNASRVPCMFLLDEANKWLPQNERESYVSKTSSQRVGRSR